MKPLLIAASLLANTAFLAVFAFRPALVPLALKDLFPRSSVSSVAAAVTPPRVDVPGKTIHGATDLASLFATDDLTALVARLRAAGFPNDAIRAVVEAKLCERYEARLLELTQGDPTRPFWKPNSSRFDPTRVGEYQRLTAERSRLMREVLGALPSGDEADVTSAQRRQYGSLPPSKIDQLERVKQDYTELEDLVRFAMNNIVLPGDREKFALLEREKRADLAALLSPEELADYDVRNSRVTSQLRATFGAFSATEEEFRTIHQIEQAFEERIDPLNGLSYLTGPERIDLMQKRAAAQKELDVQLQAALGDQRYAEFIRASDRDYQQLVRLAQREDLPTESTNQVWSLRDQSSQEFNRISRDATLESEQKAAALQSLVQNTRAQLTASLGPAAGEAYAKTANWIGSIERSAAAIRAMAAREAQSSAATAPSAATAR